MLATIVLQEMSVRLAVITQRGLATTLRSALAHHWTGKVAMGLVVAAVGFGNAAYESGNIAGAALALTGVTPLPAVAWILIVGAAAIALLFLPHYRHLERVLISLVLTMSGIFIVSAVMLSPPWSALGRGMLLPTIPDGSLLTVIALIGTTVVPYNLFLQSNAARERWSTSHDRSASLKAARTDTIVSVSLGGVVTLAILSTAVVVFYASGRPFAAQDLAAQLESTLGPSGRYVFAVGLFAAGLSSAITAPVAAAYAVCGALGLTDHLRGSAFRAVAIAVIVTGTAFAALGARPLSLILFAQAANGLLLPFIAIVLLWLMNQRGYIGDAANGWLSNTLGALVVIATVGLGAHKILSVLA